jgi:hypothetical protein
MRAAAPFFAAAAAILLSHRAMADTALIYRVDSASATIVRHHLVISASGAVSSGGWSKPELVIRQASAPEAKTIKARFVARPPASRDAVVQALLPISVRKTLSLPRYGARDVKITAKTNSVTVPITR